MFMKTFIHILQNRLSNKYSDIEFGFYVLRRNRYAHMGLDKSILTLIWVAGCGWVILPPGGFPLITKKK